VTRRTAAAAAAAALLAGCGGHSGSGSLPEGAGKAPAETPAFVSLRTDPSSAQWKNAVALAGHFPGLRAQLARLDKYKDAVGPELDVVWLDLANGGDDLVALTKPRDLAQLKTLVQPDTATYSTLSEGWIVIAANRALVDRFKHEAEGDKLDGDKAFKNGFGKLDAKSAVRAWAQGAAIQTALDRALVRGGAAPRITHEAGDLKAISAQAKAGSGGLAIDAYGLIDPTPNAKTFAPSLQKAVPARPALYVASAGLGRPLRVLLRMVGDSDPNFDEQLSRVQSVLGVDLEQDVYPLLAGESALAIYPGARVPPVLFLQRVDDEAKADRLLRRLSAIAQLSGQARADTVQLAGTTVQRLRLKGSSVTIYGGVAGGRIFVANTLPLARQAVSGPTTALAADPLFQQAQRAASPPSKVAALAYGDLQHGLPFLFFAARQSGSPVPRSAVANAKPLRSSFVYLLPDSDGLRLSGSATIK
jgi:hypothetical protein